MWVTFAFAKATHIFFQQKYCESDIVLPRTGHILTTNELVKLTRLETLLLRGARSRIMFSQLSVVNLAQS